MSHGYYDWAVGETLLRPLGWQTRTETEARYWPVAWMRAGLGLRLLAEITIGSANPADLGETIGQSPGRYY